MLTRFAPKRVQLKQEEVVFLFAQNKKSDSDLGLLQFSVWWKKMTQVVSILKRQGNSLIADGNFCFGRGLHLEIVIKHGAARNEILGRTYTLGMGGIGNIRDVVALAICDAGRTFFEDLHD